jgi:CheY-like chemotaxis protein
MGATYFRARISTSTTLGLEIAELGAGGSMHAPVVLLVDDDVDFRTVLTEVLADEGCRVLQAGNGREALCVLDGVTPDVILMDLIMPVDNGWSLFAAIEERRELREVPVAFLTAIPRMAPRGGSLILKKPLDLSSLMRVLHLVHPTHPESESRLKAGESADIAIQSFASTKTRGPI